MKKEVLFAVILGLVLGGILLYGIQLADRSGKEALTTTNPTSIPSSSPTPITTNITIAPTPKSEQGNVVIASPLDHSVSSKSSLKITGTAPANTQLVLTSEEDERIITTGNDGTFSTDFNLAGGENNITISLLTNNSTLVSQTISIIYTTAKLDD